MAVHAWLRLAGHRHFGCQVIYMLFCAQRIIYSMHDPAASKVRLAATARLNCIIMLAVVVAVDIASSVHAVVFLSCWRCLAAGSCRC